MRSQHNWLLRSARCITNSSPAFLVLPTVLLCPCLLMSVCGALAVAAREVYGTHGFPLHCTPTYIARSSLPRRAHPAYTASCRDAKAPVLAAPTSGRPELAHNCTRCKSVAIQRCKSRRTPLDKAVLRNTANTSVAECLVSCKVLKGV
jgi:hypothetical protein